MSLRRRRGRVPTKLAHLQTTKHTPQTGTQAQTEANSECFHSRKRPFLSGQWGRLECWGSGERVAAEGGGCRIGAEGGAGRIGACCSLGSDLPRVAPHPFHTFPGALVPEMEMDALPAQGRKQIIRENNLAVSEANADGTWRHSVSWCKDYRESACFLGSIWTLALVSFVTIHSGPSYLCSHTQGRFRRGPGRGRRQQQTGWTRAAPAKGRPLGC